MCGRYFLELKALMELEDKIDYLFELALKDKIDYYPSNNIFIIEIEGLCRVFACLSGALIQPV